MDGSPWDFENWDLGKQEFKNKQTFHQIVNQGNLTRRAWDVSTTNAFFWEKISEIPESGGTECVSGAGGALIASVRYKQREKILSH